LKLENHSFLRLNVWKKLQTFTYVKILTKVIVSEILKTINLTIEDEKENNFKTHLLDNAIESVKTKKETEYVSVSHHTEDGTPWIQSKRFTQTKLFEM